MAHEQEPDATEGLTPEEALEEQISQYETQAAAKDATIEAQQATIDELKAGSSPSDSERVMDLEDRVADLTDKLARARADYDNLQKRVARDAQLERERAKARVLEGFLQVFEYGKMAEQEAEKTPGALAEGVKMVVREFERLIESEGVQTIGTVGEAFDPALHEAIGEEDGAEPGHISRVVKPGYLLGTRVLRYAKVAVAPT